MHDLLRPCRRKKVRPLHYRRFPPAIKIDGKITPVSNQTLSAQHTSELARAIMNDRQAADFEASKECNFAISPSGIGRFRVNALVQRGARGGGLPHHQHDHPQPRRTRHARGTQGHRHDQARSDHLRRRHRHRQDNLAGGAWSTTATATATAISSPSRTRSSIVHDHKNCIVTQREVGIDTDSWEAALKNTLRQAPDVILMGEIRDRETMDYAVAFAETGHLCLATLHANSANQAIDRIINFFLEERRPQLLMDLSLNLRAMISQRLLPKKDGKGRVAAVEIMLNSPLISDLIFKGEVHEIKEIMKKSRELGMQTFDQALFDLYEAGRISYEDALRNADSVNDLRLQIKLHGKESKDRDLTTGIGHLDIV